jgi:hypothetical protein
MFWLIKCVICLKAAAVILEMVIQLFSLYYKFSFMIGAFCSCAKYITLNSSLSPSGAQAAELVQFNRGTMRSAVVKCSLENDLLNIVLTITLQINYVACIF